MIKIHYYRLLLPLVFLISWYITNENIMLGFTIGYLLCWIFDFSYFNNHSLQKGVFISPSFLSSVNSEGEEFTSVDTSLKTRGKN